MEEFLTAGAQENLFPNLSLSLTFLLALLSLETGFYKGGRASKGRMAWEKGVGGKHVVYISLILGYHTTYYTLSSSPVTNEWL